MVFSPMALSRPGLGRPDPDSRKGARFVTPAVDLFVRDLTLALARRAVEIHRPDAGRCDLCRVTSPCAAALRAGAVIASLAVPLRAVGVARVARDQIMDPG